MNEQQWLAYQFDYQPVHVGLQLLLSSVLDPETAAKVVFAIVDEVEQRAIVEQALANPQEMARAVAGHRDLEPTIEQWCEDLVLTTWQVVHYQHLHWLRPLTEMMGRDRARRAVLEASRTRRSITSERTFPRMLENIQHPEALLVWQSNIFDANARAPRSHDKTYAATRYRETQGRGIEYLQVVSEMHERVGLAIQARQLWKTMVLAQWLGRGGAQSAPISDEQKCAVIGAMLALLDGPLVVRRFGRGSGRQAEPPPEGDARRNRQPAASSGTPATAKAPATARFTAGTGGSSSKGGRQAGRTMRHPHEDTEQQHGFESSTVHNNQHSKWVLESGGFGEVSCVISRVSDTLAEQIGGMQGCRRPPPLHHVGARQVRGPREGRQERSGGADQTGLRLRACSLFLCPPNLARHFSFCR